MEFMLKHRRAQDDISPISFYLTLASTLSRKSSQKKSATARWRAAAPIIKRGLIFPSLLSPINGMVQMS